MLFPFSHFNLSSYSFTLKVIESLNLPEYKGAVLRGGFGYAFRKVVCIVKDKECPVCLLKEKCVYAYVFETSPPKETALMRKYPTVPHPFILTPPLEDDRLYEPGEEIKFELTLIGRAQDFLPYFIYTFEELGKRGLGKGRGKYNLEEVRILSDALERKSKRKEVIYNSGEKVLHSAQLKPLAIDYTPISTSNLHLLFLTPTRLKFQGDLTSNLEFHIFFRNLLRRISLLAYFHCGLELAIDFRGLIKKAEDIKTERRNLRWYDWERYSTRQQIKMKLGGFLGEVVFSGNFEPFWPYLVLGEYTHVGKGSSFGLGKYEILGKKSTDKRETTDDKQ